MAAVGGNRSELGHAPVVIRVIKVRPHYEVQDTATAGVDGAKVGLDGGEANTEVANNTIIKTNIFFISFLSKIIYNP